jgi:hypothetical protein
LIDSCISDVVWTIETNKEFKWRRKKVGKREKKQGNGEEEEDRGEKQPTNYFILQKCSDNNIKIWLNRLGN